MSKRDAAAPPAAGGRTASRRKLAPTAQQALAPRKPVTRRGRLSRARLCEAAAKVFGELGYHDASVSEIAREAGVAQGTFYVHFDSKHAIFAELVRSLNEEIRARARETVKDAPDPLAAEERQLLAVFGLILERPELYRTVFEAEFVDQELSKEHYFRITDGWARRLRPHLREPEADGPDPEALVFCLFGIAAFVGMRWPYWTKKPPPDEVLRTAMQFIRNGLGPFLKDGAPDE